MIFIRTYFLPDKYDFEKLDKNYLELSWRVPINTLSISIYRLFDFFIGAPWGKFNTNHEFLFLTLYKE
jgi:hypothetical protein